MKRVLVGVVASAVAFTAVVSAASDFQAEGWNFSAPVINGVGNIPDPEAGQIVFDSSDSLFKGRAYGGGWQTLSPGGVSLSVEAISAAYTLASTDDVILASGATTLTLPSASTNAGKVYEIRKTDSTNTITIVPSGVDTFSGASDSSTTLTLRVQNDYVKLAAASPDAGTTWHWYIIGDQRTVAAVYTSNTAHSFATGSTPLLVNFEDKVEDTYDAVTTGTGWNFEAPLSGEYIISGYVQFGNASWTAFNQITMHLFKNGSLMRVLGQFTSTTGTYFPSIVGGSTLTRLSLSAGDVIDFRVRHGEGSSRSLNADSNYNHISIVRVGN